MGALIITFIVLLLINAPIAFVIGGAGMAWFISAGRNLDILAQYVVTQTQSISFLAVPFFIFAGNLARMEGVNALMSSLLERDTLLVSVLSCQFISNVPSAILLSRFTTDYPALLLGVNIGGAGTLIASLASLITFREYTSHNPGKAGKYILQFSLYNFAFLGILLVFASFVR